MSNGIREIRLPQINWEEIEKNVLPREQAEPMVRDTVRFLIEVHMLKATGFLVAKSTEEKMREYRAKLEALKNDFSGITSICQQAFGLLAKEWAEKDGDSKILFARLEVLVSEALHDDRHQGQGVLQEWTEENLKKVSFGLKNNFEVRIKNSRGFFYHFLPASWRSETHKRIALILRDLSFKATTAWKTEKGIPAKSTAEKPETKPTETRTTEATSDEQKTTPKSKSPKVRLKTRKEKEDDAETRKQKRIPAKTQEETEIDLKKLNGASLEQVQSTYKS